MSKCRKFIRPSEIMFNQSSISDHFQDGNSIEETLDDLKNDSLSVSDIPLITVYKRGTNWVTKNNRRLWVFRNLEESGRCSNVLVLVDHHCDKGSYRTDTVRVRKSNMFTARYNSPEETDIVGYRRNGAMTAKPSAVYNGYDSPEETDIVGYRRNGAMTAKPSAVYNGYDTDESLQALGTAGKVVAGIGIVGLFAGLALKVVSDIARNRRDN